GFLTSAPPVQRGGGENGRPITDSKMVINARCCVQNEFPAYNRGGVNHRPRGYDSAGANFHVISDHGVRMERRGQSVSSGQGFFSGLNPCLTISEADDQIFNSMLNQVIQLFLSAKNHLPQKLLSFARRINTVQ